MEAHSCQENKLIKWVLIKGIVLDFREIHSCWKRDRSHSHMCTLNIKLESAGGEKKHTYCITIWRQIVYSSKSYSTNGGCCVGSYWIVFMILCSLLSGLFGSSQTDEMLQHRVSHESAFQYLLKSNQKLPTGNSTSGWFSHVVYVFHFMSSGVFCPDVCSYIINSH